ncbi:hypothetical protein [Paenochrobactrum glaciei]|uniref:Uncharacterized protein n=1 Tax=Paenochrobactrum glaciei TaxID=486407 RepID=A0ABP3QTU9_9HYPH
MFHGSGTLSKLPPLTAKKAGKPAWKTINKPAKPVATIPKMKAVVKLAEKLGKTVTGLSVNGDGGFTIKLSDPNAQDSIINPFDVVLK